MFLFTLLEPLFELILSKRRITPESKNTERTKTPIILPLQYRDNIKQKDLKKRQKLSTQI